MDSNDNSNQSAPAAYLEITDFKREPNEDSSCETDNINQAIYLNQQKLHEVSENNVDDISISGVKRKNSEENSLNMQEDDSMSEVTNSPSVVVKRRRYSDSQCESISNSNDILDTNNLQCKEEIATYTLFVTNSPGEWTSQQIINFIREECGINISTIKDSREGNTESDFQIKLKFPSKEQLNRVHEKLKQRESEGKLKVHTNDDNCEGGNDVESDAMAQTDEREPTNADSPLIPDLDQIEIASDENAFYIREDYLNSLGIKMPITKWVTVTNFRCGKSELKEVLELAGTVLVCSVISISNKYANVMYSHPLEAVQAISMLNGQKFYGQTLKLTMNNSKDTNMLLPKGLADVGPGLGKYGKGLPDLVEQYKRFVKGQKSSIDVHLFQPELLRKIGIDPERDTSTPVVRSVASNSSSNHNDNVSEHGSDISPSDSSSTRNNGSQFGVIGQRITNSTNSTMNTQNTPNTPQFHNNRVSNFTPSNQQAIIRSNGPVINVRGQNSPMPVSSSIQGPRHLAPAPNAMPVYPNCPPIPGVDSTNTIRGSYSISVIGTTPMPAITGPIMTRGPLPSPMPSPISSPINPMRRPGPIPISHMSGPTNRFPCPGPRNVGPNIGPRAPVPVQNPIQVTNPIRPNGPGIPIRPYLHTNVQMFKGADAVTIQITNLPPSTNFVNLCQKLSEFGHVVFLEFTTPGCAVVRFLNPAEADKCLRILL
ncbi:unnamed protein product [Euphydryas editha]|uniref:RRM domain-containing protein n=1 Tax=Euphydryas editha TaxID=104508 RepID=A0AAU9TLW3_EUPED|nr:unnamed protein product [Euphydryas editha]